MTWNEHLHPRDTDGQFTHKGVGDWVRQVSDAWGRNFDARALRYEAQQGNTPEGHAEAAHRLDQLLGQPHRTPAEHAETRELEDAFATYRQHLGMEPVREGAPWYRIPGGRQVFDRYGELADEGPVTDQRPAAGRAGYRRVGDHPKGAGLPGRGAVTHWTPSTHPDAGGLWVDPANPGTRARPRYVNDMGFATGAADKPRTRSDLRREGIQTRRQGAARGRADGLDVRRWTDMRSPENGTYRDWSGEFGYGARGEFATQGPAQVFVARMKRAQPRARQETGRQAMRRTPRGTAVSPWMDAVNSQMSKTRG